MTWTFQAYFRIRYSSLRGEDPECLIQYDEATGERISLWSGDKTTPVEQATVFALEGSGYATEEQAKDRGSHWLVAAKRAFAETHLGGDFREREPANQVTPAVAESMRMFGRLEQIRRGVMTFRTDAEPNFVHRSGIGIVMRDMDQLRQAILTQGGREPDLTPSQELAHNLYASAFHETSPETSLLVLTSALEALVDQKGRGEGVLAFVDRAIALAGESDLGSDRESILGALRDLRRRSVGQACRELLLALDLPVRRESPTKIFNTAYKVRSRLIHGDSTQPSRTEVRKALDPMRELVGDVLARI